MFVVVWKDAFSAFTARRYASAVYDVAVCRYVSVCLSVTSRYRVETTRRIELVLAWKLSLTYPYTELQGNSGVSKIRVLSAGTLSQTLDLENFATTSQQRCQLNSSTVELVDCTCGNRRVVARCTLLNITSRSTATPVASYFGYRTCFVVSCSFRAYI